MSPSALRKIIQALDDQILADPSIDAVLFAHLRAQERKLGLLHGDRPTCPFLRPLILSRAQYEAIGSAARTIAEAFESLVAQALKDKTLLAELGLTATEEKMARIDPGYARLCVTSRLDAYLSDADFHFLEYNAENPAGIGDQTQLETVLCEVPPVKAFIEKYNCWLPRPHRQLLAALLRTYREWGGDQTSPQIAIVDWDGVATASEFIVLRDYFESEGTSTIIADPGALEFDGDVLRVADFRVDIVYKRVIIHEFLQNCGEEHPLARAYSERKVCMCNSFRSKVAHKKAGFAILSDPQYSGLFSAPQLDVIRRHVPWTRLVRRGPTTFDGAECDLVQLLRKERARLVLKPNDEYGGSGVVLGWETNAADWERAIDVALARPYVAQERVPVKKTLFPVFDEVARATPMIVDFNPFLFDNQVEGALVRLSATSLSNISSGGGQTALLVLEV